MIKIVLLILLAEIWGITGQILYKKSANRAKMPDLRNIWSYLKFMKEVFSMPSLWAGFGCIFMGLVTFLFALAQTDLSIAFPIDSMQYIVALIASHFFLGEKINKYKLIGTLLVMAGVFLVAMS